MRGHTNIKFNRSSYEAIVLEEEEANLQAGTEPVPERQSIVFQNIP